MADWRTVLRRHRSELVTQLSLGDFNCVLDRLYGEGVLSAHSYENSLLGYGDSPGLVQWKIRSFLRAFEANLIIEKLQMFHQALLYVERTDAAQLLGQSLAQPEVCHVDNLYL